MLDLPFHYDTFGLFRAMAYYLFRGAYHHHHSMAAIRRSCSPRASSRYRPKVPGAEVAVGLRHPPARRYSPAPMWDTTATRPTA